MKLKQYGFFFKGIEPGPPVGAATRIEQGFRWQSECRVETLTQNGGPRLFHIYVMPRRRAKHILGFDLPL